MMYVKLPGLAFIRHSVKFNYHVIFVDPWVFHGPFDIYCS